MFNLEPIFLSFWVLGTTADNKGERRSGHIALVSCV